MNTLRIRLSLGLVGLVAALGAGAEECPAPEGNLLNNPEFRVDSSGEIAEWNQELDPMVTKCVSVVDGAMVFAPTNGVVTPRQRDLQLVAGGKYRLGVWVKTRGLKADRCSVLIFNWAWEAEAGLTGCFPADTQGKWVRLEKEIVVPESRIGLYVFAFYVKNGRGELAFRKPWLVPADDLAKSRSRRAPRMSEMTGFGKRLRTPRPAPCTYRPERRLNALVRRLKSGTAKSGNVAFSAPREGWIWISLDCGGSETKVLLDGKEVIRFREGERFETMRRVASGDHTLRFVGATGGAFVVNEIPQIFAYPYPQVFGKPGSWVQRRCRTFQGDFCRKYLLPVLNTISYGYGIGSIPKADFDDMRGRGVEYVHQTGWWNKQLAGYDGYPEPPDHMVARFLAHPGQAAADVDGTSYDEMPINVVTEKWNYTQALRQMMDAPRPFYTWTSGTLFADTPLNREYLAACLDVADGRGRFLFECYPKPVATEAEAAAYFDDKLNEPIRRAKRLLPGSESGSLVVLGLYNSLCGNSYNAHTQIDTKRFYELFVRHLATDPEFDGLAGTGLYAFDNGSEEDVRWISKLFRHYFLEGRTDLLSDAYGYAYRPGFLANGDFSDGLTGWTSRPAGKESVAVRKIKGLGAKALRVSGDSGRCDTAVVFRREPRGANVLTGRMRGLKPGALYSFRFVVTDVKALTAKDGATARSLGIDADLRGVELVTGDVALGRYGLRERQTAHANVRTVVFRALSPEAEVQFSDASADNGEELAVNAVLVAPYFTE